jgi:hypothetical protein
MSLTCVDAEPLLPLVADGVLGPAEDPALFDHLATCPECQEALARHDLITLALAHGRPEPVRRPRLRPWHLAIPLAAAAAVAMAVALPTAAPAPPPEPQAAPAPTPTAIHITREATVLPGALPGRSLILVRRGDQVLVVDPLPPAPAAPADTLPASVRY